MKLAFYGSFLLLAVAFNWSQKDEGVILWAALGAICFYFFSKTRGNFWAYVLALFWPLTFVLFFLGRGRADSGAKKGTQICRNCGHEIGFSQRTNVHLGFLKLSTNPCEQVGKRCVPMD